MLEPKKVTVNGNDYTVQPMNPVEVIEFAHGYIAAAARGESMGKFVRKAVSKCLDPMNRPLGDGVNFDKWFADHPEDLLPLGNDALDEILRPFVKSRSDTEKTVNN